MLKNRTIKFAFLITLIVLIAFIYTVSAVVDNATKSQLYSDVNEIPKNKVGILLGTSKYLDKTRNIINPYYEYRIDAAVALYMAGKIDFIIVSGDNGNKYYDEPLLMKNDLIARGVPPEKIYMDNAGFRTLDSILRCKYVFGQEKFTIISQAFHNQRAVFIANHKHISTVAFNAKDGDSLWDWLQIRERFARVKMLLDLITNRGARYYGEKIDII